MLQKIKFLVFVFLILQISLCAQNLGIGPNTFDPDPSAGVEMQFTNKGLLIPRLTLTQRNAISSPATSLLIYQTDNTPGYYYNAGTSSSPNWVRLATTGLDGSGVATRVAFWSGANTLSSNANLYWDNTNSRLGVGTSAPITKFEIYGGHSDTKARLYSTGNGATLDASLDMWASEPNWTYDGSGIGNNVNGSPYYGRRNGNLGQSYIRFYNGDVYIATGSGDATNRVFIQNNGNVGIGTTSPAQKLDVSGGNIRTTGQLISTIATGTAPLSVASTTLVTNLNADMLDGYHYSSSWPNPSNMVTGSGTANYVSKWTGTYTQGNSIIYDNGTNVGIGTTSPTEKLDVVGNIKASGVAYWGNSGTRTETRHDAGAMGVRSGFYETSAPAPAANWPAGASGWWHLLDIRHSNTGNNYAMQFAGSFYDQDLYFRKTNNNAAQPWVKILTTANGVDGSGTLNYVPKWTPDGTTLGNSQIFDNGTNVGIGTTSPAQKLDVSGGNIRTTGQLMSTITTGTAPLSVASTTLVTNLNADMLDGHHWSEVPTIPTNNVTGSGTATRVAFWSGANTLSSNANLYWDNTNSRLGVGTSSPAEKLHINGSIRGDQSGALRINTGSGYIDIGPKNTSWAHFYTDRSRYWFSTGLTVETGNIGSYDEDLSLQTSGTTRITILNSNGNVGIGTTTPAQKLHVVGTTRISTLANSTGAIVKSDANGDLSKTNLTGSASDVLLGNGTFGTIANAGGVTSSCGTANYIPKMNSSTSMSCSQIFDNGTNVGIGATTSPQYRTHIKLSGSTETTLLNLHLSGTTTNQAAILRFTNTTNTDATGNYSSYIAGIRTNSPSSGAQALAFGTSSSSSPPVERMRIDPNGNVGIGTTTPQTALHVAPTSTSYVFNDGFEDGTLSPFTTNGTANWTISTTSPYAGSYCAESGTIAASQSTYIQLTQTLPSPGQISFAYKTSSESGFDKLNFYIDGSLINSWSGEIAWTVVSFSVVPGSHTFKWEYSKDGSVNSGSDKVWIDEIKISNLSDLAIIEGNTDISGNTNIGGNAIVNGSAGIGITSPTKKLQVNGTFGVDIDNNSNSPPHTGYVASTDIAFSRDDISEWTTLHSSGVDDAVSLVQSIGFTFNLFGNDYTTFYVSTNGFIAFGSSPSSSYSNYALPSSSFSMPVICPYWDDMKTKGNGIRTALLGTSPNRVRIIDFELETYTGSYAVTFQVILHEKSNLISIRYYLVAPNACGQSATIGIQGPGGSVATAIPISCNAKVLDDNFEPLSISFCPVIY